MSVKTALTVVAVTMAVMWAANQAAARSATFRKFVRGGPLSVVDNTNSQAV